MTEKDDFKATFDQLKAILKPYEAKLTVVHDTNRNYYLETNYVMKNKQRLFFAAVRIGKAYVSFHHILTQLFGHSWYHRGQIALLLRSIGAEPAVTDLVFLDPRAG